MKRIFRLAAAAIIASVALSCSFGKKDEVKNVIYLIGDGMGFGAVSTALLTHDEATGFEMDPVIGFQETCSANNYVTDSPAGGTALATGTRTCNGYLGIDPDGNQLESVLKKAQALGKKTGIVVNTTLTEATPGAFYAGVKSRKESYKIAEQFTQSGVDVAIGSGLSAFVGRPDSVDMTQVLRDKGYQVYLKWEEVLANEAERFVGILPMENVHRRNKVQVSRSAVDGSVISTTANVPSSEGEGGLSEPKVYLPKATAVALEALEKNSPKGFFLMIESAIIDGYGHNNDSEGMKEEMAEVNQLLVQLVKYVESHPNTLLVVTADHETGGTGVAYKSYEVGGTSEVVLGFSTKGHTGTVVPVFAYGAGAEEFGCPMKNTDLPKKIDALMKK